MTDAPDEFLLAALRRTCGLDARGPSRAALDRAIGLSRLLPRAAPGGPAIWLDRARALVARLVADEPSAALQGVRGVDSARVRRWELDGLAVEVEIESALGGDEGPRLAIRGQIDGDRLASVEGAPVIAVDAGGAPLVSTLVERGGCFVLTAPRTAIDLVIAAPDGVVLLERLDGDAGC